MKIEIDFEIDELVWFINPKTMKSESAKLRGIKIWIIKGEQKIKYNLDIPSPNEEFYVWNVYKTKEDLIKSM